MQTREILDTTLLRELAMSDSGFIFDPHSGHTFTTNATGLAILRVMIAFDARNVTASTIAKDLADRFDVPEDTDLARDVLDFLAMLKACGLVR